MVLRITVKRSSDEWFVARCAAPEVQSQGRTPLSALKNLTKVLSIVKTLGAWHCKPPATNRRKGESRCNG